MEFVKLFVGCFIFFFCLYLFIRILVGIIVLIIKIFTYIFYFIAKIFKPNIQKPRIIMKKQKSYIRRNSAKDKYEYDHNF